MAHFNKARASTLVSTLLLGLASMCSPHSAQASPNYPGLLQAALEKQFAPESFCAPLCTACHLTTQGGPGMLNDFAISLLPLGLAKSNNGANDGTVATSIAKLFAIPPPSTAPLNAQGEVDSDGDGVSDAEELKNYDSPSVPGARGKGQFCSDLKYGCAGGRIAAAAPPADAIGLLSTGFLVASVAAIRRRRRRRVKRVA